LTGKEYAKLMESSWRWYDLRSPSPPLEPSPETVDLLAADVRTLQPASGQRCSAEGETQGRVERRYSK
jgi:hypothetical protein